MRFWIVDSETTGLDPEKDRAVEVGAILIEDGEYVKHYSSLINPGIPIPPEASAVHHIVDSMVQGAPGIEAALQPILEEEVDYIVAHNAKFDQGFLDLGNYDWLCSWKLAQKIWKEAPSYSNQVLRYYLGLPDPVLGGHAHRALYDVEVTTSLFKEICQSATTDDPWEAMLKVTNSPVLLRKCNFGEHFGKLWSEVPRSYLDWIVNKSKKDSWDEDKWFTACYWYDRTS